MKEYPILFKAEMVKAVLEGRKIQVRRINGFGIIKEEPNRYKYHGLDDDGCALFEDLKPEITPWIKPIKCPYGQPGDVLWVRETFAAPPEYDDCKPTELPHRETFLSEIIYKEESPDYRIEDLGSFWRPSIHLPRRFSRILLEVVSVRVERVQETSYSDAQAEGVEKCGCSDCSCKALRDFEKLWDSIYQNWSENPYVWVIEFKVKEGLKDEC